ncbi:hypothetical protein ACO0LB_02920 [Undibacterium sp. SXout7W]|uniref:hypothetical protein n=1 Tax=Undibacterium sp. SXout7W TaxID=3413049 RepID=UPI003BF3A07B
MKQSTQTTLVFVFGLLVSSLFMSQTMINQRLASGHHQGVKQEQNQAPYQEQMQIVTIVAKSMSEEQKVAYDQESSRMQTVIISAKRLSPEQKLAMDLQADQQNSIARDTVATQEAQADKI